MKTIRPIGGIGPAQGLSVRQALAVRNSRKRRAAAQAVVRSSFLQKLRRIFNGNSA